MNIENEITAALERLNRLLSEKDPAIVEEFAPGADTILIGSEAGEIAAGRAQLEEFFQHILSLPVTLGWEWEEIKVSAAGGVAWFYAAGEVVMRGADGRQSAPYRMTGVLERIGERWLWRQLHGSEPAGGS